MEIKKYSLKIKGKSLIESCDLKFYEGTINHIVGKNGVGKSQVAKDFVLNNSNKIDKSISVNTTLISSSSNVPNDVTKQYLVKLLKDRFSVNDKINDLEKMLNLDVIPNNVLIKNLSDGQKQKLKLLSFLLEDKPVIILDEITNALDKKTINDIYIFLNQFIKKDQTKTIINITHNLSDLSNLQGKYFIFNDKKILEYQTKEQVIDDYINL